MEIIRALEFPIKKNRKFMAFLHELNSLLNLIIQENITAYLESSSDYRNFVLGYFKTQNRYPSILDNLYGNKAKYFRIVIEQCRRILLSRAHQQNLLKDIHLDYDEFKKEHKKVSRAEYNNLRRCKSVNLTARVDTLEIDYTTECDQISQVNFKIENRYIHIEFRFKYSDKENKADSELIQQVSIPLHKFKYTPEKISRPKIIMRGKKLVLSFCYMKTSDFMNQTGFVMGIDIGQVKSATAAVINTFGFLSPELTVSDRTQFISDKINVLENEQRLIYDKEQRIFKLFNEETEKCKRLKSHRLHLRSKVGRLKNELACLTARDMISHAKAFKVETIYLENLKWVRDNVHTKWSFSLLQKKIRENAYAENIRVYTVSSKNTSGVNPFTLEKEEINANRQLVKCLFDRDYAAAIVIARRGIKEPINDFAYAVQKPIKPSLRQFKFDSYLGSCNKLPQ